MILLTILLIMLVALIVVAVTLISAGGVIFTVMFADVIVCIAIIVFAIRFIYKRKRRKK